MVTNTPIGVFAPIVILPSGLDFTVVHQLLRQTSTCPTTGAMSFVTADCAMDFTATSKAPRPTPEESYQQRLDDVWRHGAAIPPFSEEPQAKPCPGESSGGRQAAERFYPISLVMMNSGLLSKLL